MGFSKEGKKGSAKKGSTKKGVTKKEEGLRFNEEGNSEEFSEEGLVLFLLLSKLVLQVLGFNEEDNTEERRVQRRRVPFNSSSSLSSS